MSCYFCPLGGGGVKPPAHAGAGQTVKSGKGERTISSSPETGAEESGRNYVYSSMNLFILT